jgi:acyl carrier protein
MDNISNEILKLLANQLKKKPEDIKPTARIKEDLGADSLDVVEILMNIEDKYKFTVPDETVMSIKTVADLTAAINKLSK